MIFVYPAIASNNIDKKIAPVVCKVIEQFFLSHLAEAFQSGTLRIKTEFDDSRDVYGPLVLENKKIVGHTFLSEGKTEDELISEANELVARFDDINSKISSSKIFSPEFLSDIKSGLSGNKKYDLVSEITQNINSLSSEIDNLLNKINIQDTNSTTHDKPLAQARTRLGEIKKLLESQMKRLESVLHKIDTEHKPASKNEKELTAKKKFEYEKGKERAGQYETHGSYKVEMMKGVSLKPTMMNMNVKIHYVGGPHKDYGGVTPSGSMQEIAIGCKILPMVLNSFESIEDAILNDYFATSEQMEWRTFYRSFLRKSMSVVDKITKFLVGRKINMTKNMNPAQSEILLAPQGYINASSFKHKGGSPDFYNYSSAIVIFNKDDIMKEEGANFFLNKNQLGKMFKAGWNSFCILDPLREEAMFISALDGGSLHIIPYAYIYNTLGMDQIYTNMNDLQRRSPVFRKSVGSFSSLVSKLKRESTLLTMMKQFISEKKHGETK